MNLQAFWQERTVQEKRAIYLAGAVLVVGFLYHVCWHPLTSSVDRLKQANQSQAELFAWMQANKDKVSTSKPSKAKPQPLFAIVQAKFSRIAAKPAQITKLDDQRVSVSLEEVSFDQFIKTLEQLSQQQSFRIDDFNARRLEKPGQVSILCILSAS